jgi:hypothetical protein
MFRFLSRVSSRAGTPWDSLLFAPPTHLLPLTSIIALCRHVNNNRALFWTTGRELLERWCHHGALDDRQGPCRGPAYQTPLLIWLLGEKIPK